MLSDRNPRLAAIKAHTGSVATTDDSRLTSSARHIAPAVSSTTDTRLKRVAWHSLPSGLMAAPNMHRSSLAGSGAQAPHVLWNPKREPLRAVSPAPKAAAAVPAAAVPVPVPAAVPSMMPAAVPTALPALVPHASPLQTPRQLQIQQCASNQVGAVWIPSSSTGSCSLPACRSGSVPRVRLAQGMVAAR